MRCRTECNSEQEDFIRRRHPSIMLHAPAAARDPGGCLLTGPTFQHRPPLSPEVRETGAPFAQLRATAQGRRVSSNSTLLEGGLGIMLPARRHGQVHLRLWRKRPSSRSTRAMSCGMMPRITQPRTSPPTISALLFELKQGGTG